MKRMTGFLLVFACLFSMAAYAGVSKSSALKTARKIVPKTYKLTEVERDDDTGDWELEFFSPHYKIEYEVNINSRTGAVRRVEKDWKGPRPSGNMKISKYIKEHLHDSRILVRLDEVRNEDILEEHYVSKDSVLVSSSMTEGIDLHDDLSTFQIIVKLPWESLGNLRTKTLSEEVPLWYSNKMWQKLLQASGRSVRSHEDYAETFVLDASFSFQHKKFSKYLPEYFEKRLIDPNA